MSRVLVLTSLLVSSLVRAESGRVDLRVKVVDSFGSPIPAASVNVELADADGTRIDDIPKPFAGLLRLRPSKYRMTIRSVGFAWRTVSVDAFEKTNDLLVGLNIANLTDRNPSVISGHILGARSTDDLWVRLVPVFNNAEITDRAVRPDSTFLYSDVPPGAYVVLLLNRDRLVVSRPVLCCTNGHADLELSLADDALKKN